jgi:signal peptidase II
MSLYQEVSIVGDLLNFTYVRNYGAAFSMSFGNEVLNRMLFSAIALLMTGVIFFLFVRSKRAWEYITFALIIGGAIGNLIDRVALGYVVDFIDCDFPDIIMERWPTFNIADSAIVVAVILLAIYTLFIEGKKSKEE